MTKNLNTILLLLILGVCQIYGQVLEIDSYTQIQSGLDIKFKQNYDQSLYQNITLVQGTQTLSNCTVMNPNPLTCRFIVQTRSTRPLAEGFYSVFYDVPVLGGGIEPKRFTTFKFIYHYPLVTSAQYSYSVFSGYSWDLYGFFGDNIVLENVSVSISGRSCIVAYANSTHITVTDAFPPLISKRIEVLEVTINGYLFKSSDLVIYYPDDENNCKNIMINNGVNPSCRCGSGKGGYRCDRDMQDDTKPSTLVGAHFSIEEFDLVFDVIQEIDRNNLELSRYLILNETMDSQRSTVTTDIQQLSIVKSETIGNEFYFDGQVTTLTMNISKWVFQSSHNNLLVSVSYHLPQLYDQECEFPITTNYQFGFQDKKQIIFSHGGDTVYAVDYKFIVSDNQYSLVDPIFKNVFYKNDTIVMDIEVPQFLHSAQFIQTITRLKNTHDNEYKCADKSSSSPLIAIIVIGVIVLVIASVIATVLIVKKKGMNRQRNQNNNINMNGYNRQIDA